MIIRNFEKNIFCWQGGTKQKIWNNRSSLRQPFRMAFAKRTVILITITTNKMQCIFENMLYGKLQILRPTLEEQNVALERYV